MQTWRNYLKEVNTEEAVCVCIRSTSSFLSFSLVLWTVRPVEVNVIEQLKSLHYETAPSWEISIEHLI